MILQADNNKINITICGQAPEGPGSIDYHHEGIRLILGNKGQIMGEINMQLYRCGWCGTRCDEYGVVLTNCTRSAEDYDNSKAVEGMCCSQKEQRQQFVEQQKIDIQDPSLEGQPL